MRKKLPITTIKQIEETDFSNFVSKLYERPYRLQQQDGCMKRGVLHIEIPSTYELDDFENDTIVEKVNGPEEGVSFKAWKNADPNLPEFEYDYQRSMFWERNFYPSLDMILNDLYKRKYIKKGEYQINIDW